MHNENPLLNFNDLPLFSKIKPEHVLPAVTTTLEKCREVVTEMVSNQDNLTWDSFCAPLDEVHDQLDKVWSPVSHMNSVVNTKELRAAYEECLPLLSDYGTWIGQHKGLFACYNKIYNSNDFQKLNQAQQKSITNALRDFHLSGIELEPEQQLRFGEISKKLSELASKFSNNVLDATMGWYKHITDKEQLTGLPQSAIDAASEAAKAKDLAGFVFTLEYPSYIPVLTYCDNCELRREMYSAFATRASDQGPLAGKFDNTAIMQEELHLRAELANLLGFKTFSDKSLATKMAESPQQVLDFLNDLAKKAKPKGEQEIKELKAFVKKEYKIDQIDSWDLAYYSEKYKQYLFKISDEDLRPYFPEKQVIKGLFAIMHKVFKMQIKPHPQKVDTWNPSVSFYDIFDNKGELRGQFYLDLYAREHKRGGAWMADCHTARITKAGERQTPVAFLTCNFNRPIGDKPALFTHIEVQTLFHEFGHGIHHMLTKIVEPSVSGISGVPWDAVELPSQFMENWCWEKDALDIISGHYQTGEKLPQEMLDKMLAAKNYQAAMFVLRQLEFGIFDFKLHTEYNLKTGAKIAETLQAVRDEVSVLETPSWNRFPQAFSHIFAGGYAAGYYSYLWAELLSADAFARFKEEGIFNAEVGADFLHAILEKGGSCEPMDLFVEFRGRKPQIKALLEAKGII